MDHIHLHGLLRELDQRTRHSLNRTIDIAFYDDIQLLERSDGDAASDFVERHVLLGHDALDTLELLAFVGDFTGRAVVLHDVERVACLGSTVQTEHLYRRRRASFGHFLAVFVEHRFHTARVYARKHYVAYVQRTVLYEHRSHVTAALVECRFDDGSRSAAVRIGLQVEHFGFEQHFFEQFVEIQALFGRNFLILVFAAPRLHEVVHLRKLLLDVVGVGCGFVDLVDGENHRDACCLGVVDRLDGLGHHVVVRRYDDDRYVGDFGTTGAHGGESLVAGGVEERDFLAVQLYTVSTDVLGDTARLTFDDVGFADIVQQRSLTVIDVCHNRYISDIAANRHRNLS